MLVFNSKFDNVFRNSSPKIIDCKSHASRCNNEICFHVTDPPEVVRTICGDARNEEGTLKKSRDPTDIRLPSPSAGPSIDNFFYTYYDHTTRLLLAARRLLHLDLCCRPLIACIVSYS